MPYIRSRARRIRGRVAASAVWEVRSIWRVRIQEVVGQAAGTNGSLRPPVEWLHIEPLTSCGACRYEVQDLSEAIRRVEAAPPSEITYLHRGNRAAALVACLELDSVIPRRSMARRL